MDKRDKKRMEVLRKREQKLRSQVAGARDQMDDPDELRALEKELADILAEIERLKKGDQ